MIKLASEMRKRSIEDFQEACEYQMRMVEKAADEGCRSTVFDPRPIAQYDAVKNEFRKYGYWFKPTGRIGGVMQTTEDICW